MAETTAIPSIFVPFKSRQLSWLIPPIATTGKPIFVVISCNWVKLTAVASSLVEVLNMAPTPK